MKPVAWIVVLALGSLALAIVTAAPMRGFKNWMMGFTNRKNPLPMVSTLMDCQFCMGFWFGAGWSWTHEYGFVGGVLFGGLVSLATVVLDLLLDLLDAVILKLKK